MTNTEIRDLLWQAIMDYEPATNEQAQECCDFLNALSAGDETFSAIAAEVGRATTKFPTWPTDPLHALAVLGEEFGELTKEVLQLVYEPHKTNRDEVRKEALQTAAMAVRFLMSLDAYAYIAGPQHEQSALAAPAPPAREDWIPECPCCGNLMERTHWYCGPCGYGLPTPASAPEGDKP